MPTEITKVGHSEVVPELGRPSRREFLKTGAGAVGSLVASSAALGSIPLGGPPAAPQPNFVIFLGEGVRADEFSSRKTGGWDGNGLSAMVNKIISTPHQDRIFREGVTFPNAFVTYALCLPSRASILTGLYPHRTGAIDNRRRHIPESVPTIADMMREAGYDVAFFGKAHVHNLSKRNWETFWGFEEAATDYYRPKLIESHHGVVLPPKMYRGYVDDIVAARALEWLNRKRDKPFCLFLWFQAPHDPFYRSRPLLNLYDGVPIPVPSTFDDDLKGYLGKPLVFKETEIKIGITIPSGGGVPSLEGLVKDHCAGVVNNDKHVGEVVSALEKTGTLDDTVIVLSADHGFFLGEWHLFDKRFMHEPSIRVPLAIRYPRKIKAGLAPTGMALNIDIAPTILDLAGIKSPDWQDWIQGRSLLPLMSIATPTSWRKDWLYEYFEYPYLHVKPNYGIRTERYKLIHYFLPPQEFELYDLQEDPGELHNLFGDRRHAKLAKDLLNRIGELKKETGDVYTYEMPNTFEYERQKE